MHLFTKNNCSHDVKKATKIQKKEERCKKHFCLTLLYSLHRGQHGSLYPLPPHYYCWSWLSFLLILFKWQFLSLFFCGLNRYTEQKINMNAKYDNFRYLMKNTNYDLPKDICKAFLLIWIQFSNVNMFHFDLKYLCFLSFLYIG